MGDSRLRAKYVLFRTEIRSLTADASMKGAIAASLENKDDTDKINIQAVEIAECLTKPTDLRNWRVTCIDVTTCLVVVEGDPVQVGTDAQLQTTIKKWFQA